MALKDDWQTGDVVTAAHLNAIADEINSGMFAALFTDNGDGTWSVGTP